MSSRSLETLSAAALPIFLAFEKKLTESGIDFVRSCTYRSSEEQNALYAQGRTTAGQIVTWARGGQSPHNRTEDGYPASWAADYYPLLNGKLADTNTETERALWAAMGIIGNECGLQWGGNWTARKHDFPHFQLNTGN